MVFKPDPVTRYRIDARQTIVGSGQQPVSPLVHDDENDVVGRLAGGRLALRSLRCAIAEVQQQAQAYQWQQASVAKIARHDLPPLISSRHSSHSLQRNV